MSAPCTINPRIVEALYSEALVLSDEVRGAFTLPRLSLRADDLARIALSSEGLRTTTRMMHAISWLLNRRAHFRGEMTDLQLRLSGRLSPDMRQSDPVQIARLDAATRHLVEATRRFYERLLRLDEAWRLAAPVAPSAIDRLRERIEGRLAG